jgi:hemerythrin-like domain-containing protein
LDITQLILDDHNEQRRLFAILEQIDQSNVEGLKAVWNRISAHLEAHVAAEEKIFYPALLRVGAEAGAEAGVEAEATDAIKDHNEIRDGLAAVKNFLVGSKDWYAAVAAVNKENGQHMDEEEREGLADFRRQAGIKLRHDLAVDFAVFECSHLLGAKTVDQDPATYVSRHE